MKWFKNLWPALLLITLVPYVMATTYPAIDNQVRFPAVQVDAADVNTLDDYEEGTFTPIAVFSAGSGTITYSTQTGEYTKIGNTVFFSIYLVTSSLSSRTGDMTIGGLPFTSGSTFRGGVSVGFASGLTITADQTITGIIGPSGTVVSLYLWDAIAGTTAVQDTEWTDDGQAILAGFYTL